MPAPHNDTPTPAAPGPVRLQSAWAHRGRPDRRSPGATALVLALVAAVGAAPALAATPSLTTLQAQPSPTAFGEFVTLTATVVQDAPVLTIPSGTVVYLNGATLLGTATLNPAGVATLTTATLPAGVLSLSAVYNGNATFDPSTSAPLEVFVDTRATRTSLIAQPNPSTAGSPVTLRATVTAQGVLPFTAVPTGDVTFFTEEKTLGTGTLNTEGVAALTLSGLALGSRDVLARYESDGTYATSTSFPVTLFIDPVASTTTLRSSANPSLRGEPVSVTASVASVSGRLSGTGNVVFIIDGATAATVALSAGEATLTTSSLAVGVHIVVARFGGDANLRASNSVALDQTVVPRTPSAPTDLRATAGPRSATIAFVPGDDGGAPISNYEVSLDDGGRWVPLAPAATASPVVLADLGADLELVVRLRAVNAVGAGAPSAAVRVTPRPLPRQLIDATTFAGAEQGCDDGGVRIDIGFDVDEDGALDAEEVTGSDVVCNGADGADGPDGEAGPESAVSTRPAAPAECPAGGVVIVVGVDDDGDGALDPAEEDTTATVCNGEDGAAGPPGDDGDDGGPGADGPTGPPGDVGDDGDDGDEGPAGPEGPTGPQGPAGNDGTTGGTGAAGLSALVRTDRASLDECPAGGIVVRTGLDDDGDGALSDEEVDDSAAVCNGESAGGDSFVDVNGDDLDDRVGLSGGTNCGSAPGAAPLALLTLLVAGRRRRRRAA